MTTCFHAHEKRRHNSKLNMESTQGVNIRAHLQGKIVEYECSSWRVQCCLRGTVPDHGSVANVATGPELNGDSILYLTMNNRIRQSYCEYKALKKLTPLYK